MASPAQSFSGFPRVHLRSHIVIPARLKSTRLPEKLLLRQTGRSVLEHTYLAAARAQAPEGIVVAVDDPRLAEEVERFGGRAIMTRPDAASGTERVAEVAASLSEIDVVVNVQGDEPEISPQAIDQLVGLLQADPQASLATLATPLHRWEDILDPACVKVVFDQQGRGLYFSRSPIPHLRDWPGGWPPAADAPPPPEGLYFQHLGLYAYRRDFLLQLSQLPPSRLAECEKLEQLQFLQAGWSIQVGLVDQPTRGIDTLKDYQAFVSRCRAC